MSKEIVDNPEPSRTPKRYRRFLLYEHTEMFNEQLQVRHITPLTHPHAVELFAGDGPGTYLLWKRNWQPENMLRIDYEKSPTPLEPAATPWLYINLRQLTYSILNHSIPDIPPQLSHSFDIVIATYASDDAGLLHPMIVETVVNYFAAPSAWICTLGSR